MLTRLYEQDFDALYQIMEQSFPADEMRPYDAQKSLFKNNDFFAYGVKDADGILTAFITLWKMDGFTFGENFAVDKSRRGSGLGSEIISRAVEISKERFILEVEPPETQIAKRRIAFYERAGFTLNDYDYTQPPLAKGQNSLKLMIMSTGGGLEKREFDDIKAQLYRKVYGVE